MSNTTQQQPVKSSDLVLAHINALSPTQLVEDEKVANKFIKLFNDVHGRKDGDLMYHAEKFHFMKRLSETPALQQCSRLSLYGCFMDAAVNGLSFDPSKKLAYVLSRNANIGTPKEPKWEKRASLAISPYGELAIRLQLGQIRHADNPVIVYAGDKFTVKTGERGTVIEHEAIIPRESTEIIASFIRITRADGSVDFHHLLKQDWERLSGFSEKQNQGKTNALYTSMNGSIDPGFLAAKTIKHAFRSYPKVIRGDFSHEEEIEVAPAIPTPIDYGTPVQQAVEVDHDFVKDEPSNDNNSVTLSDNDF